MNDALIALEHCTHLTAIIRACIALGELRQGNGWRTGRDMMFLNIAAVHFHGVCASSGRRTDRPTSCIHHLINIIAVVRRAVAVFSNGL